MVNMHYELQAKDDVTEGGTYYLYRGLVDDFETILYRLNLLEEALGLALSDWPDPPGSIDYPCCGVQHPTLGTTSLASAINHARTAAGVAPFPFAAFPTSDTLGTDHWSNGISLRHPVEAFEAIGRRLSDAGGFSYFGRSAQRTGLFANDFDRMTLDETFSDVGGGGAGKKTATGLSRLLISGLSGGNYGSRAYEEAGAQANWSIAGIDTRRNVTVGNADHLMDDFELPNAAKITVVSLGTSGGGAAPAFSFVGPRPISGIADSPPLGNWWTDGLPDFSGPTYRWQNLEFPFSLSYRFGSSVGSAGWASRDTIPATVGEAIAGRGNTNHRYVYVCPDLTVGFHPGEEIPEPRTDAGDLSEYRYQVRYGGIVHVTGPVETGGNWLFWNEPVLPTGWPNDSLT